VCSVTFWQQNSSPCAAVKLEGSAIDFVSNAKYLGVMLHSSKQFAVDLHYMKVKFYKSFNCLFHKAVMAGSKMNLKLYIWSHHSAGHTCYMLLNALV